ncbi:MAG: NAD(P)H-dependent oxidoreductase [Spirosomataceae bacterium]
MKEADKYVFIVPEYNGSFPGALKVFIDGLGYPSELLHKSSFGRYFRWSARGALALSHLIDVFNYLGMNTLAQRVKIPL